MRGATIAGMIVVNNPGTWAAVYAPLLHAEWDGWTYTDTIFPFFLFLAGVSMTLSYGERRGAGAGAAVLARKTAVRSAILVGLGLLLNLVGFLAFHREHYRIPGVLQRIGLCVLVAGLIYLAAGVRGAAAAAALLLAGYAVLLASGPLDPSGNVAALVDRAILGAHTWKPEYDPEGLLSTLPAIATTLLGTLAGARLRGPGSTARKTLELSAAGAVLTGIGLAWGGVLPINKSLWSSSYSVLMSGLAAIALAACIALIDGRGGIARRVASPLIWLGRNAIAAFTLSSLVSIALIAIHVPPADAAAKPRSLWTAIHRGIFDRFADPRVGSLAFALAYLAFWIAVFGLFYRKRVFVKI